MSISEPQMRDRVALCRAGGRRLLLVGAVIAAAAAGAAPALAQADSITARMEASTVRISLLARMNDGSLETVSSGSGFVLPGNYVATNAHVVGSKAEVVQGMVASVLARGSGVDSVRLHRTLEEEIRSVQYVISLGADRHVPATVVSRSGAKDLAILQPAHSLGRPAVVLVPRQQVHKRQTVYAVGFPGAADRSEQSSFETKITRGIVSAPITDEAGRHLYQIDAVIHGGNSGGPLFDECGQVIGVNTEGATNAPGVNWAVQADELLPLLRSAGIPAAQAARPCSPEAASGFLLSQTRDAVHRSEQRSDAAERAARDASHRVAAAQQEADSLRRTTAHTEREVAAANGRITEAMRQARAADAGLRQARSDLQAARTQQRLVLGGTGAALLLGIAALGVALTARGRTAVKAAASRSRAVVSRTFAPRAAALPTVAREQPVLRGLDGEFAGKILELGTTPTIIGRDPRLAHLVFSPSTTAISSRHCELRYSTALRQFTLEDLGSTNGTFLSTGTRVTPGSPGRLRPGDRFYVGSEMHLFEVHLATPTDGRS